MTDHEPYEVLCALAATGQLSASEKANFDDHYMQCPACRRQLQDLISIGAQLQLDAAIHAIPARMSAGSFERFRARAIHEGIALRSTSARPFPLYTLAPVAAVFLIVAALVFIPGKRRAPERLAILAATPTPMQQELPASVTSRKSTPRPSKAIHAHFVRHRFVPHTDKGVNQASLTAQQFPQVITASYSFFGPESATKPLPTGYPALSRPQISRFALFPEINDSSTTNVASIGTFNRPIDVESIGKTFDFAGNIRQVYFQLPTAQ